VKPVHLEMLSILAHIYLVNNKVDRSLPLLRALRLLAPENHQVVYSLVYALLQAGSVDEAVLELSQLRTEARDERGTMIHFFLEAQLLWQQGQTNESRVALRSMLETLPQPTPSHE